MSAIFWAQAELAAELCSRAAEAITPAQLDHVEAVMREHQTAVRKALDSDTIVALGHDFHRTFNLAANSRRLALMLRSIVRQLPNRFYNDIEGHSDDTMQRIQKSLRRDANAGPR